MTDHHIPMDVFKHEMNSDDLDQRVNTIYRVEIIAHLIGKEKIKKDLIPYFESKI